MQVRAGQVFEFRGPLIVTDLKSSVEASCDIGRERRERVRGKKSAPSSNYQRGWENERVTCCCFPVEPAARQWRAGCCEPHARQTCGRGHDAKLHRPRLKLRHGSVVAFVGDATVRVIVTTRGLGSCGCGCT